MHPLADITDYEARHGVISAGDSGVVNTLLEDASALVLEVAEGSVATWVTDEDADTPRAIIYVCVSVANRVLERGEGISREQLGEYAVSYSNDGPSTLWLTRQERRIIRKAAGLSSAQSLTLVSPYSGDGPTAPIFENDLFPLIEEGS